MTRIKYSFTGFSCLVTLFIACSSCNFRKADVSPHSFTKTDSLTEQYLVFQDSMLQSWNSMINDDNFKIRRMKSLLQQLKTLNQHNPEILNLLDQRLTQLETMRYDQKTMIRSEVIEEYNFLTNSLITELSTLAESIDSPDKKELRTSLDEIKSADRRVAVHHRNYDQIAIAYNQFIDINKIYIEEGDKDISLEKKPLFTDSVGLE